MPIIATQMGARRFFRSIAARISGEGLSERFFEILRLRLRISSGFGKKFNPPAHKVFPQHSLGLTMPLEQAAATRNLFAELRGRLLLAAAAQRYR